MWWCWGERRSEGEVVLGVMSAFTCKAKWAGINNKHPTAQQQRGLALEHRGWQLQVRCGSFL